jgi:hypothetical protein
MLNILYEFHDKLKINRLQTTKEVAYLYVNACSPVNTCDYGFSPVSGCFGFSHMNAIFSLQFLTDHVTGHKSFITTAKHPSDAVLVVAVSLSMTSPNTYDQRLPVVVVRLVYNPIQNMEFLSEAEHHMKLSGY